MEIRIDNTITIQDIKTLKAIFETFFCTDFNIVIEGSYVYFRDC